ncbi:hypothetical protein TVAG_081920 [Trichomonas vaginalis G3]|uniref:Uncharacterized protein n=1 Tax=Trichomonas vaginalis (strain ATCC PRA-98 / G3) TaxID=412133 RepID=A2E6Y4_TRIV3|nr:hypothetical protein TVAGG3_0492800 [Trichomonas vaginalis G3]EAY11620.1 hypothetical protein TVAG_081920 [Trichomonas vaginalis G3]KAI5516499.1 hypothetical protein TVAGG3_0492800 [Trichomonas vaginalis G3]|eukprot:XP_001323843.1 hypothetical protein [Trichomonas vaginalis G3]
MHPFINNQCITILDNALASPLGLAALNYFKSFKLNYENVFPIQKIQEKLKKNEYKSITEFVDEVKETFLTSARSLNSDSEISLALQTICKIICNKSLQLEGSTPNQFQFNIQQISEILNNILPSIPDSMEELDKALSSQDYIPINDNIPLLPNLGDDGTPVDPNEIYDKLLRLPTDDDVSKVIDIVAHYESAYSHEDCVMKIELAKCHQYTLRLIKNYLENVELLDEDTIQKTE